MKAQLYEAGAELFNEPDEVRMLEDEGTLQSYVLDKMRTWEDFVDANYFTQWDEYYRIWRGYWAAEDKTRQSERSRIVTPATQQAVESSTADIEEAKIGRASCRERVSDYV